MGLSHFGVVKDHSAIDSVLVCSFDGEQKPVLALISHKVVDEYFQNVHLNKEQRDGLIFANLTVIGKIISKKYDSGAVGCTHGAGRIAFSSCGYHPC